MFNNGLRSWLVAGAVLVGSWTLGAGCGGGSNGGADAGHAGSTGTAGAAAGSTGAAGATAGSTGAAGAAGTPPDAGADGPIDAATDASSADASDASSDAGDGASDTGAEGGGTNAAKCAMCELAGTKAGTCCQTSSTPNLGTTDLAKFGCNGFTGADKTNCDALVSCMRTKKCGKADDPTPCLCGALAPDQCATTAIANLTGGCVAQYVAAAAGGDVFGLFFSTDSPIGISNNLYTCDVDACPTAGTCFP
jgi:hypothetical protein